MSVDQVWTYLYWLPILLEYSQDPCVFQFPGFSAIQNKISETPDKTRQSNLNSDMTVGLSLQQNTLC